MRMTHHTPSPELAPYVKVFTVVEATEDSASAPLPHPGLIIGVRYRGSAKEDGQRLPDFSLTGVRRAARHLFTTAGGGIVVAAFHETGAAHFIRSPLHELFGRTVPLDDLVARSDVDRLGAQVAEAKDDPARIASMESFLLARLAREPIEPVITRAVRALRVSRGTLRIATLADQLGINQDALEKRFRSAIGTSPKQLASLLQLQFAVDSHRAGASLTQAAFDAGYADQSHFIRAFRAVTGQAPRQFFRATPRP